VIERRRWPRRQVAWSARLVIGGGKAIAAKAMDASLHGLRLALGEDALASTAIRHGESCAVEVHVPHSEARFVRQAEVRHVGEHEIGLIITEPLPAVLVPSLRESVTKTTPASPPARGDDRTSVMVRLRSLALALRRR
jgi:hypothetical protein